MKNRCLQLLLVFLLCSCNKLLDLKPRDNMSEKTFYKTPADFKLAANALYNSLPGFDFADVESDIAFNQANAVSDGDYLPPENDANWTNAYYYIRNANIMITKGTAFADAETKRYVAEAKFFRALSYWNIFRLFGGVPLVTDVLTETDERLYGPRASRQETVGLIIQDLKEAVADLPKQNDLSAADQGRITRGAASGLLARVTLFEGTWQKYHQQTAAADYLGMAIEAAGNIIAGQEYALFKDKAAQSYRYLFIEEGNGAKENILDRRYAVNVSGQGYPYSVGDPGYLPTKKLADMYLCKDGLPISKSESFKGYATIGSEFENRDPRMTMTFIIPGTYTVRPFHPVTPIQNWPTSPQRNGNTGYITYKYISENAYGNGNNGVNFGFYRHLIRYAEILLIYAEAIYEKNGGISDADLDKSINLLRDRVNMPRLTNAFVSQNGLNMLTEIRRERTLELALEGFRYDDIRRWKTAETEMPGAVTGIKIKNTEWNTIAPYSQASYQSRVDGNGFLVVQAATARKFDPAKHYLRPLPTKEIALSKGNLKQNPSW
ncbi:RagB/SusD family nutrient uptake outer membrane protein [Niabella pedocola]|uniref:RagB/SusD family nutrient uptake outer membrane protein n=1 Tax=Niabella pedocola TaxID=1752077 RepID=A0ABS8PVJ6_9BACT|nr:RagB/SusD family nutrient uptake outer membrane protein [Niabella pedocola]MCD2425090.1 RagB/SusD family nutrient uptake outer membrane protein [Niabella pedocola]